MEEAKRVEKQAAPRREAPFLALHARARHDKRQCNLTTHLRPHQSSLASIVAIQESGGVIILEMMKKEYSMSEIAQIVESNGARILSAYITDVDDRDIIKLTLKLNIIDIAPIIQTFERYKYTVAASYNQSENKDNLTDRYELLMRYLNP